MNVYIYTYQSLYIYICLLLLDNKKGLIVCHLPFFVYVALSTHSLTQALTAEKEAAKSHAAATGPRALDRLLIHAFFC